MKRKLIITFTVVIFLLGVMMIWKQRQTDSETRRKTNISAKFDKTRYSINSPGSIWWIVNKKRPLPDGYVPPDLAAPSVPLRLASDEQEMQMSKQALPSVQSLFSKAKSTGYSLVLASGYRSQVLQQQLYNGYVESEGQSNADASSAKPGTSEHQTGLAMDVCLEGTDCNLQQSFGNTPAGKWLVSHAHEYGFIVRYQRGKEAVTGYEYEPWHLRYVGTYLANELYKDNLTMEEFFGLH